MLSKLIATFFALLVLTTFSVSSQQALASTILEQSMEDISQNAELVFEGEVLSARTEASPVNGFPFTYFTFRINDVIKGAYAGETIELGYAGGTLNGQSMQIADLQMPQTGERGVYFVESLSKSMVHPLYGWHQGHYIVEQDSAGVSRVRPQREGGIEGLASTSSVLSLSPTLDSFKASVKALNQ